MLTDELQFTFDEFAVDATAGSDIPADAGDAAETDDEAMGRLLPPAGDSAAVPAALKGAVSGRMLRPALSASNRAGRRGAAPMDLVAALAASAPTFEVCLLATSSTGCCYCY